MEQDKTRPDPPRALLAAWGSETRTRPGPRPRFTIGDLARTGVELADEEGLEGVTMARVADRLGYTPMSLYRYVGSKDELVQLMFDETGRDLDLPTSRAGCWRDGLAALADSLMNRYLEHPWALDVPITGAPTMPNQVAIMEYGLELLVPEGLDPGEALGVLQLVAGLVRTQAALLRDLTRAADPGATLSPFASAVFALADLVDPEQMPRVAELARSGLLVPPPDGPSVAAGAVDDLHFGLGRILDGVELLIDRRRGEKSH